MAERTVSPLSLLRSTLLRLTLTALIPLVAVLVAGVCASASDKRNGEEFLVPPPPLTPGIFPCSSCHEGMEPNAQRRDLTEHTNIKLRHAPEVITWCFSCHDAKNRDKLHLVNGDLIDFTESYRLCGQCHGTNYRDWKAGIHGKRIGYFAGGARSYFLCVNCHNPHDPKFKPLRPEPPPFRPLDKQNGP
ncbi:MAG: hypothetical protein ABSD38_30225 [Syntrophorhabdales bacterium]|jgi:hypothetical protein